MPPKKDKTKEFAYALIWFISTHERYVLETSKLPKTQRKKDSVVKILWNDANTQISKQYKVKIIELSSKYEYIKLKTSAKLKINILMRLCLALF